mmetsp:Transcript_12967/g.14359  ORF Transcript_12967/g.14359 Transcript_12967/m.14359 type:complete len:283 (-) Transcript_12967:93-941(-)
MSRNRPELKAPPELYYDEMEAKRYSRNNHMVDVQRGLAARCLELLHLPEDTGPLMILDVGCGSGLSGEVIEEAGHFMIGMDISPAMLEIARHKEFEGDLFLWDMGHGVSFRPGTFDGVISVSAVQWLCNSDTKHNKISRRMKAFFDSLYAALKRGGRAALQFYPQNAQQIELLTRFAMQSGFTGGVVVDYPNSTKAKKYYMCLFAGQQIHQQGVALPPRPNLSHVQVEFERRRKERHSRNNRAVKGSRQWIKNKKQSLRAQGKDVRPTTRRTGRLRNNKKFF